MKGAAEVQKLTGLLDELTAHAVHCYENEYISSGRFREVLGIRDVVSGRDFFAEYKKSPLTYPAFRWEKWIEEKRQKENE